MTDRPRRPARPQIELEVLSTRRLSPHLVRLVLGGDGFAQFTSNAFTDRYVKIFFSPSGEELHPPFDLAELRATLPADRVPVTRTYTVREVNEAEGWLAVDFVVHGDEGIAGPWAARVQPGETVTFLGPGSLAPAITCLGNWPGNHETAIDSRGYRAGGRTARRGECRQ